MTAYRVVISPQAKQRLRDIRRYLKEELSLPHSANDLMAEVRTKLEVLTTLPRAYAVDEHASKIIEQEVRSMRAHSFKVLYWIDEENLTILVFTVRFGNEDPANLRRSDFPL